MEPKDRAILRISYSASADAKILDLSAMELSELPSEISSLKRLKVLNLSGNSIKRIPLELGKLKQLKRLDASRNILEELEIKDFQLYQLITLNLSVNKLKKIPKSICSLYNLVSLDLKSNKIKKIPIELVGLRNLTYLDLSSNKIETIPEEVVQLQSLTSLDLSDNQINDLPRGLVQIPSLKKINLSGNPLNNFPPEIRSQGSDAILEYLKRQIEGGTRQWVSKLLIVGEGGAGKTSLLRALQGKNFSPDESTTHGISVDELRLPHPKYKNITMHLNAWDFGGQEIYHATHQFFLTNRSLFILVWNARLGFEQGRLVYWLKTIRANAPQSPILLVATHIDERDADLPLRDLKEQFPMIIGQCEISSKTGQGIKILKLNIIKASSKLPLMGEIWPINWLKFAQFTRKTKAKYAKPEDFWGVMRRANIELASQPVLAKWLHELGDILFFIDKPDLQELVILKPQWVTGYISRVLEDPIVISRNGIFSKKRMNLIWRDLKLELRNHFLRLMEKFDLSYLIPENKDISLIVERLPFDPPNYIEKWNNLNQITPCREISMKFLLSEILPGIPTWFIARQHRFTINLHWRTGVLLAYGEEQKHLGLLKLGLDERLNSEYLQLTVRGPMPHNFFDLLKEGVEVTLNRYPGLQVTRLIPCPDPGRINCIHEFDYSNLTKRLEKVPPKESIECPNCLENISVTQLLFGLHYTTHDAVLSRIERLEKRIGDAISTSYQELRSLLQRDFLRRFRQEQKFPETCCPNVFSIRSDDPSLRDKLSDIKSIGSSRIKIQLYCQAPGQWHPTDENGSYTVKISPEWLQTISPLFRNMVKVIKFASPLVSPVLGVYAPQLNEEIQSDIALMTSIASKLPTIDQGSKELSQSIEDPELKRLEGAALRELRSFLDQKDPLKRWGGLKLVLTPEGDYLWLCEKHAEEYASSYSNYSNQKDETTR